MRSAPIGEVKAHFHDYLDTCEIEGPLVITRNGRVVAVLLTPTDDEDLERLLLARSPRFQAFLERSRKSIREGKGLSEKVFWQSVRARKKRTNKKDIR